MRYPYTIFTLFFWLLLGCNAESNQKTGPKPQKIILEKPNPPTANRQVDYADFLKGLNLVDLTTAQRIATFFTFMKEDIPSYWIGTKWAFHGTTRLPQEGKIACGYFVTNVLSDFGMTIKRIYLAQQPSSVMIKELCAKNSVQRFSELARLKQYLEDSHEKEVFIIGLDFHTGFIIKDGEEYYFLHANYINQEGVIKEELDQSTALKNSNTFMIGSLTRNTSLFE